MLKINEVTVLGANGVMGTAIAGMFASFGRAKVYMVSREYEKSLEGIEKAIKSVRADSIRARLIPKTYEDIKDCISSSQWVLESLSENIEIKKKINKKINSFCKPDTIISTGTSGLSIEILKNYINRKNRSNYFGIHFFNPPYKMQLCELIRTKDSSRDTINKIKEYLEKILYRKVVIIDDSPAFLANRIGFQFLNEAILLAEKYKSRGGIDYIDSIFGPYTGRSLPPFLTIDFIGLDIHKSIVENLYKNVDYLFKESFILPKYVSKLIMEKRLGVKTNGGFYKKVLGNNGETNIMVYDIHSGEYRNIRKYNFPYVVQMKYLIRQGKYKEAFNFLVYDNSEESKICKRLLVKYLIYSIFVVKESNLSLSEADTVMAYGFNWAPVSMFIEMFGYDFIMKNVEEDIGLSTKINGFDIGFFLKNFKNNNSRIDYRKYIKAGL